MRKTQSTWLRASSFAMLCVTCVACGDGAGPRPFEIECADSAVEADKVALSCGPQIAQDTMTIKAVVAGPTMSTDIVGFTFDVVFHSPSFSYVPSSARKGTLLDQDGTPTLLAAGVASDDPDRLLIAIHRTSGSGIQAPSGTSLILEFLVRADVLERQGSTQLRFENAEAVDSLGTPIGSITFSDQILLSVE